MRKILLIVAAVSVLASCQSAGQQYINTMGDALEIIIPHHVKYIESDEKLTKDERAAMVKAAMEVLELSREAKEKNEN
jgi:hypothetical protein